MGEGSAARNALEFQFAPSCLATYISSPQLRGPSGVHILGALSILRELSLTGPVGPATRRPPTRV